MMFSTRLATALLAVVLTTTATGSTINSKQARMTFHDTFEINGEYIVVRGSIGPSSFFENLRPVDSGDETVFLNDVGEVRFFPNRMTITLFVIGPFALSRGNGRLANADPNHMGEIDFKAEWKRGVKLRSVKAFRQLTASVTELPPDLAPLALWGVRECWIYEFVIEDSGVPIDDHLILSIMSPQNKRLVRLDAHL